MISHKSVEELGQDSASLDAFRRWSDAKPLTRNGPGTAVRYLRDESGDGPPDTLITAMRDQQTGEITGFLTAELYADDGDLWPINFDIVEEAIWIPEIGDLVRLKGSRTEMVVVVDPFVEGERSLVRCAWHTGSKPESEIYPIAALERISRMAFPTP